VRWDEKRGGNHSAERYRAKARKKSKIEIEKTNARQTAPRRTVLKPAKKGKGREEARSYYGQWLQKGFPIKNGIGNNGAYPILLFLPGGVFPQKERVE